MRNRSLLSSPRKPAAPARAILTALAAVALVAGFGCKRAAQQEQETSDGPVEAAPGGARSPSDSKPRATTAAKPLPPPPAEIWKEFSGERAFEAVRAQVDLGPRPSGSAEIEKARVLIEDSLRKSGWTVERQTFTDETPRGPITFANVVARFPASGSGPASHKTQRAIVCSHFDTKRFSTIRFVGASDGASSTGALLELARVLALDPALAAKIELVFFDGEEALVQFTESDGLYGSRHYAAKLRESGRAAQFKFGILWDMIGDRDLTITLSSDSPPELTREILAAAETLGLREHFSMFDRPIFDDHVSLNRIRIPTIDLIDFDYPAWHTADDTLERLSPVSLQKIGAVTLFHLRKALAK